MRACLNPFPAIALAALAVACAPAHAATSTATASIEQFALRLVDLDLNDGITPSISFRPLHTSVMTVGGGRGEELDTYGSTAIETVFGTAAGTVSDTTVSSSASINHPLPFGSLHGYRNDSFRSTEFTLSPNTQLIVSAVGKMSRELPEYVSSSTSHLRMLGYLWDDRGLWLDDFNKAYYSPVGSTTIDLTSSLISDGKARTGRFYLSSYAILSGPVMSVPEPSTYAMLLAGTFVVGALARRRRQVRLAPAA